MTKKIQDGQKTLDGQSLAVKSGGLNHPHMKLTSAIHSVVTTKGALISLLKFVGESQVSNVTDMLDDVVQLLKAVKIKHGNDTLVNVMDTILDEASENDGYTLKELKEES